MLDIHPTVSMPTNVNVLEILANCFPETVNVDQDKWLGITSYIAVLTKEEIWFEEINFHNQASINQFYQIQKTASQR